MKPLSVLACMLVKRVPMKKPLATGVLTNKKSGELDYLDSSGRCWFVVGTGWWKAKIARVIQSESILVAQTISKPWFVDALDEPIEFPTLESANDNRVLHQIDHGTGAICANKLALPYASVGFAFGFAGFL
jgi:hypothetical protein